MQVYFRTIIVFLCSLLLSCNDDSSNTFVGSSNNSAFCSVPEQNRYVHELLQDVYLWYQDVLPQIDYTSFSSPRQTLDFLRADQDRFSSITSAATFDNLFNEGQYLGYGFSVITEADGSALLRFVYDDSPAGREGLQRGDEILSVNNQSAQQISLAFAWSSIFGPDQKGYPVTMLVRKKDGSVIDVQMQKTQVNINTVLHSSIIQNGTENIGYLVFNSFLATSSAELENAFATLKASAVSQLILDMRYNGGGSVPVANTLASYLHANSSSDQLFARLQHNDKHRSRDSAYFFRSLVNQLDLQQLVVVTTEATCSASEMIINGMKPYLDVVTVGSSTCGKPVGMNGYLFCDQLALPVSFAVFNSNNEGDYFNGIAANCPAQDDVNTAFGDEQEAMLSAALYLSRNNSCQPLAARKSAGTAALINPHDYLRSVIGAY
jgi:carboxyl-terminal processing protease